MKPVIACSVFLLVCCPNAAAQPVAPSPTGLHLVEAVQSAISRHPGLELQRQEVEIGNAVHQQASGVFDQLFAASVNHGRLYGPFGGLSGFTLAPNDSSQVLASYSKLLRSGISIGGSVDLLRQVDNGGLLGGLSTSTTRLNVVVAADARTRHRGHHGERQGGRPPAGQLGARIEAPHRHADGQGGVELLGVRCGRSLQGRGRRIGCPRRAPGRQHAGVDRRRRFSAQRSRLGVSQRGGPRVCALRVRTGLRRSAAATVARHGQHRDGLHGHHRAR